MTGLMSRSARTRIIERSLCVERVSLPRCAQFAIAKSDLIISVDVAKTHLFPAVHGAIEA